MEALVGLIEAITKNWSVFPPIYFPLFNNNNEKKKNKRNKFVTAIFPFHPSGYFSSAAFTLQDSAEKRTIPTHGSGEKWASPEKQRDEDGRASLCAHPEPKNLQQIQVMMKHSAILFWIQYQCRAVVVCGICFWADLCVDWSEATCCFWCSAYVTGSECSILSFHAVVTLVSWLSLNRSVGNPWSWWTLKAAGRHLCCFQTLVRIQISVTYAGLQSTITVFNADTYDLTWKCCWH